MKTYGQYCPIARAGETVKAMTREQRDAFLATAARNKPDVYPAWAGDLV